MKSTISRWAFLFPALIFIACALATQAQAASLGAQLQLTKIDPGLQWPGDLRSGQVVINTQDKEIILKLARGTDCPANAFCRETEQGDVEIRLPLAERHTDPCGAVVYTGLRHDSNGAQEKLTVFDNAALSCFIRKPKTEVLYVKSSTMPSQKSEAYMKADKLQ
jgi:hypothetical protein